MKLSEVVHTLQAEVLCGEEWLDCEIDTICGADLMSDVLAFATGRTILLTGLTNIQVVRTAFLSDLVGIVFIRGKKPGADIIAMAAEKGIPLMATAYPMYEACGRLYFRQTQEPKRCGDQVERQSKNFARV